MSTYEKSVYENPRNPNIWQEYAESISDPKQRAEILTRAVTNCPESAVLWRALVAVRVSNLAGCSSREYETVRGVLSSALYHHSQDEFLWTALLSHFPCRRTFDSALRSPNVPDENIWPMYAEWAVSTERFEALDVFERRLEFDPDSLKDSVSIVAAKDPVSAFKLARSSSSLEAWRLALQLVCDHPLLFPEAEKEFSTALRQFPKEDHWIVVLEAQWLSKLSRNSDVILRLERAARSASSRRSLSILLGALNQFCTGIQDALINAERLEESKIIADRLAAFLGYERLLLNNIRVRYHPYDADAWLTRLKLVREDNRHKVFSRAKTLMYSDQFIPGDRSLIIVQYAALLPAEEARAILDQGIKDLRSKEDLERLWLAKAFLEQPSEALTILLQAINGTHPKSTRLWREALAVARKCQTAEEVDLLYERALSAGAVSMRLVVAQAEYLSQAGKPLETLRAYELALPKVQGSSKRQVWRSYIERSSGMSIEFQRQQYILAWESAAAPTETSSAAGANRVWLSRQWAILEGEHGFPSDVWRVMREALNRASNKTEIGKAATLCLEWVVLAENDLGEEVLTTILGKEGISDSTALSAALELAGLKEARQLISEAREIYVWATQFTDPLMPSDQAFWEAWTDFELRNGFGKATVEAERSRRLEVAKTDVWLLAKRRQSGIPI